MVLELSAPIPKSRYTSPDFLARELGELFPRTWLFAGPASDLEGGLDGIGAWFTFEHAAESVLVARGADDVRAFHNVCSHRGRQLCEPGRGRSPDFTCPYHGWRYQLDGALAHAPDAEAFRACGPPERHGLKPVACEVWQGMVWVSFAPSPEPLADYLGPLAARLAPYRFEEYALVEDQTVELECNWKVGVDAFNEAYHLASVHPELLDALDESRAEIELLGRHSVLRVPFGAPSERAAHRDTPGEPLQRLLADAGLDPERFALPPSEARGAIQRHLRRRGDLDLAALDDAQLTDNHQYYVFPNLTLNLYAMRAMVLRHRPHPSDPNRMLLDQQQYVRVPVGARRPPRPQAERFRCGEGSLGFVTDQDTFNLTRVQRGLRSSGFSHLVLGEAEARLRHMHATIDDYLK